jgi:hypothetical protein
MAVLTLGTRMMTAQNTIEAVIGLVMVVIFILLSIKTVFFTKIYIKFYKSKKEEK